LNRHLNLMFMAPKNDTAIWSYGDGLWRSCGLVFN
jgi:hypothetical protein